MNALVLGFAALAGGAVAAMPGIAPTPGYGVPLQAAFNGDDWEHCSDDEDMGNWTFTHTLEGCKAKCVELYPNVSAAELYFDEGDAFCCCQGLTAAQANMTWCHINESAISDGGQSYYWLTGPCAEPAACIFNETDEDGPPLFTDGMYDCVATDVAPTTTTVTPDTDSSTSAASSTTVTSSEVAASSTTVTSSEVASSSTPASTTVAVAVATAGAPTNETANTTAAATSTTQTVSEVSKAPASYVLIMVGLCVVALFVH